MAKRSPTVWLSRLLAVLLVFTGGPHEVDAQCDVIPSAEREFRSARGTIDRPFWLSDEVAETLLLGLDRNTPENPDGCDPATGFVDLPGGSALEDDYFATVLFKAPAGTTSAVIVTTAAMESTCQSLVLACGAQVSGTATCQVAGPSPSDFAIQSEELMSLALPDTEALVGGVSDDRTLTGPVLVAVTSTAAALPCDLTAFTCADCLANPGSCGSAAQLVACVDEFYAQDGTCDTGPSAELDGPFEQLTALPPANDFSALCLADPGAPCSDSIDELRFTIDSTGSALVPIDWRGVLVQSDRVPIPRLVSGRTDFSAFGGVGGQCVGGTAEGLACDATAPIDECDAGTCIDAVFVPNEGLLSSYSLGGHRLPPIFSPLRDPGATSAGDLQLFGSVDAPVGVMRIARRSDEHRACFGGGFEGLPCELDLDCPGPGASCEPGVCRGGATPGSVCADDATCGGGVCGPILFDFSARLQDGIGPVVIDGTQDALELHATNPVPLDGLLQSRDLFAFVASEGIDSVSLNDDPDTTDSVVRLRDRTTGIVLPIGTTSTDGRAVTRIREAQFSYPAIAVEDDIVAFLEPEPLEGDCSTHGLCDKNGDGDLMDTILRVYRVVPDCTGSGPCAEDVLPPASEIAIDAAPRVGHRSIAISEGRVYFRRPEWAGMPQVTRVVSVASDGTQASRPLILPVTMDEPAISDDGRVVVFDSNAHDLDPADAGLLTDVFRHDRDFDGDGILDEVGQLGGTETTRVNGAGGEARHPVISADGSIVAYEQNSAMDSVKQIWVRDYVALSTGRASVVSGAMGGAGDAESIKPDISSDGRWVSFISAAANFVFGSGDTNAAPDVFLHDRVGLVTTRMNVASGGEETAGAEINQSAPVADSGTVIAFTSSASDVVALPAEVDGTEDVFVRDETALETRRVSESATGEQADDASEYPGLAGGGRFVGFHSFQSTLVAGDTNGVADIFVRDLETGLVERVSVAADGAQGSLSASGFPPSLSDDGRFVVFASSGRQLTAQVQAGQGDVFIHDRLTGLTDLVSVLEVSCHLGEIPGTSNFECCADPAPSEPFVGPSCNEFADSGLQHISGDGRFVVFQSNADLLDPGDTNGEPDIFVRGPDTQDPVAFAANNFAGGDAALDDIVLQVIDTNLPAPMPVTLGPAGDVVVFDGSAAFLATLDGVGQIYLSFGGTVPDPLGQNAVEIALSSSQLAALVPDGLGANEVWTYDWTAPEPSWTNLGLAAREIGVDGDLIAAIADDGRLQIFDTSISMSGRLLSPPDAEDFVVGPDIVAFRTSEADEMADLNGDGDQTDFVMQVYHSPSDQIINTQQAAIRCPLEACDPRIPYSIDSGVVTFLTLEPEQDGQDLNADGDGDDLVKQVFAVDEAVERAAVLALQGMTLDPLQCLTTLASAGLGICSNTGEACRDDTGCLDAISMTQGECYVPPGRCLLPDQPATACDPSDQSACGGQSTPSFCYSEDGINGFCHEDRGSCSFDDSCADAMAFCVDAGSDVHRLVSPILPPNGSSEDPIVSIGACFETTSHVCTGDDDCVSGLCGGGQLCLRRHGSCRSVADCPGLAGTTSNPGDMTCQAQLIIVGAADSDGDGTLDPFDALPSTPNHGILACPEPGFAIGLGTGLVPLCGLSRRRRLRESVG